MRPYPFLYHPQIAVLLHAYRKRLKDGERGPEGTVGEYEAKLATLSLDELLDRLLVACPETYERAAFECLPGHEQLQRLMALAFGHLRAETHWPLIGEFFHGLRFRSRHDSFDWEAARDAIITVFSQRLTDEQKERVGDQLATFVDFSDVVQGNRREPWFIDRFAPIGEYYLPWMLDVLGSTVGTVSELIYTRYYPESCRMNQLFGGTPLNCVTLTLDFRDDPRRYWDPTPADVVERLGACITTGPDSPHIVLFMRGIASAAADLGRPEQAHQLGKLVFLHEFAHAVHLGLEDTDGIRNPAAPPPWKRTDWVELVAQMFTWHVVKRDAALADLFERLTDISPPEYQTWRTMRDCSMEDFRAYLWFLRRNGAAKNGFDFQDWFCAEYAQLPPIPKPPTKENVTLNATSAIDE